MTNDLTTLSGALLEMKDELIYQLGQKGVTASYSSTDGLLGLIGKIADIQTGGGGSCYHIEFSEASYTAVGGSCTVEVYLQSNYAPLSGATVTVTGSDSSLYTGITDNSGVAEVTVSVSSATTFTCSYSNVTDTCEVIAETFGFYDDFSSATLDPNWITYGASVTTTVSNGALTMTKSSSGVGGIYYNKQITGDYKITLEVASSTYNCYCFGIIRNGNNNGYNFYQAQPNYSFEYMNLTDTGSESSVKNYGSMSISHNNSTIVMEVIKDTSVKIYKNGTLQKTYTLTNGTTDGYVGFKQCCNRSAVINSIKVEAL